MNTLTDDIPRLLNGLPSQISALTPDPSPGFIMQPNPWTPAMK